MIANTRIYGAILFFQHGYTPWGHPLREAGEQPSISFCGRDDEPGEWIVCCGHTVSIDEIDELRRVGVVAAGPKDRFGRPTVVAGPAIGRWLGDMWEAIEIATGRDIVAEEAGREPTGRGS